MKPSIVAAVLLGLAPLTSLAQPLAAPAPAQAAEPTAPWSLGAGVGWTGYGAPSTYLGATFGTPSAPIVRASLERAVAPAWWVELGFSGSADRRRGDAPDASGSVTRNDQATAALNLGLRRALTRPGAPVCVSIDLALATGYATTRSDWATTPARVLRGEAWQLGITSGLAVERELTSGLSLRVGTSLLGASWNQASAEDSVTGKVTQKGGSAFLTLSPWLELRQAF